MKNRVIWIMFMVVALVSAGAWASWDPNGPELQFKMDFQRNNDPCTKAYVPTSINTAGGTYGYLWGRHSLGVEANMIPTPGGHHDIYELNSLSLPGLGTDANFQPGHDGKGLKSAPNDIKIRIPYLNPSGFYPGGNAMFDIDTTGSVGSFPVRTWAFWIWTMHKDDNYHLLYPNGSIIRLARTAGGGDPNWFWEISLNNCQVQFQQKSGTGSQSTLLTAQTTQTLDDMNMTPNQWHHVAVVINRNTKAGTRMFVDGLERAVTVTDYRTQQAQAIADYIDTHDNQRYNPLMVGSGKKKFDGMLDEIRLYNRALQPVEVSILKQTNDTNHPIALQPIPNSTDVIIGTDVNWVPAKTVSLSTQYVYFGTNPSALPLITSNHSPSLNFVSHTLLNGGDSLALNTAYYWVVDSNYAPTNSPVDGPLWSFTTETGKARNPTPFDGQDYVSGPNNNLKLMWDEPATHPTSYTVYLSSDQTLVEECNVALARIMDSVDANDANKVVTARGAQMFWRVVSNYPSTQVKGDVWTFRTRPYEIIFNTSKANGFGLLGKKVRYSNHDVNALAMVIHDANWNEIKYGTVDPDVNIAVFNFTSGFSYDRRYDIVVIPTYMADDIHYDLHPEYDVNTPRPLGLHVTGNFYFDGRINISSDDVTIAGNPNEKACSGGYPGPKSNCGEVSVFNDHPSTGTGSIAMTNYWTPYACSSAVSGSHGRVSGQASLSGKFVYIPLPTAKAIWGPGTPANPPYKGGSGASYGGQGGNCGRGYFFGVETTLGRTYGDSPIPWPWGGSAGGWSGGGQGGGGGGGIEIIATGDVNLDAHSAIFANGGNEIIAALNYGTGGGAGGSVKIISLTGKVTNKGHITANGGCGSDATQANNGGGGGGGGRVAIHYVSASSTRGAIDVNGGAHGWYTNDSLNPGVSDNLAENGQDGTVLFTTASPKTASAPSPVNGERFAYIGTDVSSSSFPLTWYSGYGATTDVVLFGTVNPPVTSVASVSATRLKIGHTVTVNVNNNTKYYWQIQTDGGAAVSPVWSFTTVNWQCPLGITNGIRHHKRTERGGTAALPIRSDPNMGIAGPEWDHNGDCVLNEEDYAFFAKDWMNPLFGPPDQYFHIPVMGYSTLRRFADEWLDCYARTNNGCANDFYPVRNNN